MNKKKIMIGCIITGVIIIVGLIFFLIVPLNHENECKRKEHQELKEKIEDVKKSVVGIISKKDSGDGRYNIEMESGIIFEKKDNTYYAVFSSSHVEKENKTYKVFTINTKFDDEKVSAGDNAILKFTREEFYDSLLKATIEYYNDKTGLAIFSFKTNEELPLIEFESKKIEIGDEIACISHTKENRYNVTYGNITEIKDVLEHNAYINFGNSGVIIDKNMKFLGINTKSSTSILGYFKSGFIISSDTIQNVIKQAHLFNNDLNQNIYSWDKDKVIIKVLQISNNNSSAIIEITDKNEKPISWGYDFTVQKMSEGDKKWYDLTSEPKIEMLRKIASPDENGITRMEIDWSNMYSNLKKGTYRIVKYNEFVTVYSNPFKIN